MNIVITGGNGFLGSKLAEKFYKENHNVTIIDIKKQIDGFKMRIINVYQIPIPNKDFYEYYS